jgi:uncharacterized protein YoxC
MNIDANTIIGFSITIISGVATYLFAKVSDHEKRVQRIEDVQGNTIEGLKDDVKTLSHKVDTLTEKVNILAANVHNKKNIDGQISQTLNLILKHFNNE